MSLGGGKQKVALEGSVILTSLLTLLKGTRTFGYRSNDSQPIMGSIRSPLRKKTRRANFPSYLGSAMALPMFYMQFYIFKCFQSQTEVLTVTVAQ